MIDIEKQTIKINWYTAATIVGMVVTATIWMNNQLNAINGTLKNLQESLDAKTADQMTKTDAAEEALRNAILNPGMRFADPRNPGQAIVVESGRIGK